MTEANIFNIRSATMSDVNAIAYILNEVGWFDHINKGSGEEIERLITEHLNLCLVDNSHTVLVAENVSGAVTGYISAHWAPFLCFTGPEGYISEIFVREESRAEGYGLALVEAVKKEAKKRDCSRLMLLNGKNRLSYIKRFYHKAGFTERPQIANFIIPLE